MPFALTHSYLESGLAAEGLADGAKALSPELASTIAPGFAALVSKASREIEDV